MIYMKFSGGLGNQVFQYSAAKELQRFLGQEVKFSYLSKTHHTHAERELTITRFCSENWEEVSNEYFWEKHRVRRIIYAVINKLFFAINRKNSKKIAELHWKLLNKLGVYQQMDRWYFSFRKPLFCIKDVYMEGMYHHPMYTESYIEEFRRNLHLKDMEQVEEIMKAQQFGSEPKAAVHVRRGDYLTVGGYAICSTDYYLNGMEYIRSHVPDVKFIVFSDDIAWCRENLKASENTVFMQEGQPDYIDFELMRSCDHFVISNSTYSWWAANLGVAENKIVITPKSWYQNSTKDWLTIDGWIALEN